MSSPPRDGMGMTSPRTRDRLIARLRAEGVADERVLEVLRELPRHLFVDEGLAVRAYDDISLPIGHGQTISQPYIVAVMTAALLEDGVPERVLEIGTGSGYQTAVLARLVDRVFTVERIRPLAERARERLKTLGIRNVRYRTDDGQRGWPDQGPFEAIIVTAAPPALPELLLEQLAPGGRMVIPVGPDGRQELVILRRTDTGIRRKALRYVRFVPLLGGVSDG